MALWQVTAAVDPRPGAARRIEQAGCRRAPIVPIGEFHYETIGALPDGDRIAHVLFRYKAAPFDSPQAEQSFAGVREDERAFVKETWARAHPFTLLCRHQADGGWLAVANHEFIGGGMHFFRVREQDRGDDDQQFDDSLELSP